MHPADMSEGAGLCALSEAEALRCVSAATVYFLVHLLSVQGSNNCCDPYPHATPQYLISDWKFR